MEHEHRWKHLDEHLLARLAGTRRTELNRLKVRDTCEGVFYSVYGIVLLESFNVSLQDIYVRVTGKEKRTWMSSWSERQCSMVAVSCWFGARTVERDFPLNMRIRGDSNDSTYSLPCVYQQCQAHRRIIGAP